MITGERMKAEELVRQFYDAFAQKNFEAMNALYHPDASFYDPVFQELRCFEVRAMWQMLCESGKDLEIKIGTIGGYDQSASVTWQAYYTFSQTGRYVHNIVSAQFTIKDDRIFRHEDSFDIWRWSRMALGLSGLLLGWSAPMKKKIRAMAAKNLQKFIENHALYRA